MAELAYAELTGESKDQAVLICGESGAGKTECCKFVLNYLISKRESTVWSRPRPAATPCPSS